ncbi:MAG: hypothetical protein M1833_002059 [Piccolia ochrophora]|nr:MAG: hypothetical protein M1833_002059 [Piccolia ochrophora]
MASRSVWPSLPSAALFKFPPNSNPNVVPAPAADFTYATTFTIPTAIYNHLLSVAYPITIALLYATSVIYVSQINSQRRYEPWKFSKTRWFFWAVIAHNIILAIYSGWTFAGMAQAIRHTWPGFSGGNGLAGAVDSLCKIHGPRGLGEAVSFNSTMDFWDTTSGSVKLLTSGTPDSTDVGRLWNEGLAFYGWLFYISKFYEILDTGIILAKGKKSSPLQIFHHAGAMMCMWAGIRYMSPPIWMFVFVNSGIHTLMYTYYTLTALSVPVPQAVKRALTTLQISQFVFGASYAAAHLFVSYTVPFSLPYTVISSFGTGVSSASSVATAVASAGLGSWIKKMGMRAAGEQGLAENVVSPDGSHPGFGDFVEKMKEEIRYKTEYRTVPCLDTSGQAFAIYLNVLYLAPLTWLFINFFIRSYNNRTSANKSQTKTEALGKAVSDATKGIGREINEEPVPPVTHIVDFRKAAKEMVEKVEKQINSVQEAVKSA